MLSDIRLRLSDIRLSDMRVFKGKEVELRELIGKRIVNFQEDGESFDIVLEDDYILEVYKSVVIKASKMETEVKKE